MQGLQSVNIEMAFVPETENPMKQYQVNFIERDENGEPLITKIETLAAKSLAAAWQEVTAVHCGKTENVRVYPLAFPWDGDSIMELARYTLASVERWERNNNHSALEPYKRTPEDKEDFVQIAALAIFEALGDRPLAPMYDIKRIGFAAIAAEKKRRVRNSEWEYLSGWSSCNTAARPPRSLTPELDELIHAAIDSAGFTDSQSAIFHRFFDGMAVIDIAQDLAISRTAVYRGLYRAEHKLLLAMDKLDPLRAAYALGGYCYSDVSETIATLAKRAK